MAKKKILLIGSAAKGEIRTLYSPDAVKILQTPGRKCRAARVSHIEVDQSRRRGFKGFYVDLRPVKGPLKRGFKDRQAALDFEIEYLIQHNIPIPAEKASKKR